MRTMSFASAIEDALSQAMAGLRPVVEIMIVDFIAVTMDALLNQAAKIETFSGGRWQAPMVVRTAAGGGYGDGSQHEQSLWGWLAHIPGLTVLVPYNPADAGGLMLAALQHDEPVVFLEHKLLAENWLEFMGAEGRKTVEFDVPDYGTRGPVPDTWEPLLIGKAALRKEGHDLTVVSVWAGVHRCLEAAEILSRQGVSAGVINPMTVSPLDAETVCQAVAETGCLLVVDEDYQGFGLSGELAAIVLEAGIRAHYGRVCTETTIPNARVLEDQTLPNTERILRASARLLEN